MMTAIRAPSTAGSLREWLLKRGILFGLTQTPMAALMIGYFFRWTTVPIATVFTVILAFAVLPAWILIRKERSTDPDEPVHHLHRLALYALAPYVVYNLARIPMHYLLNIVFWDHWYDFGAELTGEPVDQWSSLIPGTFIHSLQGYVLALGFYILYKRHSLLSSLAYVFLFLSVIYTWTFPRYVLVDFQPPPKWFFVVWWAHFWMALAAWAVPKLYAARPWTRLRSGLARGAAAAILLLVYFTPVLFVFWRVGTWQFPLQRAIDEETFGRTELVLHDGPRLRLVEVQAGEPILAEAHYDFTLRLGPRIYTDYINAQKALDVAPLVLDGRLILDGRPIAWCTGYIPELESPNQILVPADYFPALERLEYTDIDASCAGPAEYALSLAEEGAEVDFYWRVTAGFIGDRETADWEMGGQITTVTISTSDDEGELLTSADPP